MIPQNNDNGHFTLLHALVTAIPAQKPLSDNSHTGAPADADIRAPADDDMDDTHEPVTDDYVAPADVDDMPPPTQVRFIDGAVYNRLSSKMINQDIILEWEMIGVIVRTEAFYILSTAP